MKNKKTAPAMKARPTEQAVKAFDLDVHVDAFKRFELKAKLEFVANMWVLADMIGEGSRNSGLTITRYIATMAEETGQSKAFLWKYLALSKRSPEDRKRVQHCTGFNEVWFFFFPPKAKGEPAAASEHGNDADEAPASETELAGGTAEDRAPDSGTQLTTNLGLPEDDDEFGADTEVVETHAVASASTEIHSALGVTGDAEALERINDLKDEARESQEEIVRLRNQIAKVEKERDELKNGADIEALLQELGVSDLKRALEAVKALKA